MSSRDITRDEFARECRRRGYRPEPAAPTLGYYHLPGGVIASVLNGGRTRRDQLEYLARQQQRYGRRHAEAA